MKNFQEYFMQHSLKFGGTNYHFKWVKVPGTAPDWNAWYVHKTIFSVFKDIWNENCKQESVH
jgi:hypothetical protein